MRSRVRRLRLWGWSLTLGIGAFAHLALAQVAMQEPAPEPERHAPYLRLTAPAEIRALRRGSLRVALMLPPGLSKSVLLTPSVEGEALEVVRGRLMGGDALDPDARPLVFELPLLARTPGRSVVRVHAVTYRCDTRCVAVE